MYFNTSICLSRRLCHAGYFGIWSPRVLKNLHLEVLGNILENIFTRWPRKTLRNIKFSYIRKYLNISYWMTVHILCNKFFSSCLNRAANRFKTCPVDIALHLTVNCEFARAAPERMRYKCCLKGWWMNGLAPAGTR